MVLDKLDGSVEKIRTVNYLEFIEPTMISVISIEMHIAEKLHAYTVPADKGNSRIKDLPDIAMLANIGALTSIDLRKAIEATFEERNTHLLPKELAAPPNNWAARYESMAHRFPTMSV